MIDQKRNKWLNLRKKAGFSLVEVLLAIGLFSILILGLIGGMTYGLQTTELASYKSRATYLLDEGLEAARAIRDRDFSLLANGTYGISSGGNIWQFSGSSDTVDDYTRQIQVSTVDSNTRQVTATVSWPQQLTPDNSISATMYLTNWLRNVVIASWASPILTGSLNLSGNDDGFKVKLQGNYAYLIRATGTPNFAVINTTNPASPTLSGSLTLPTNLTGIAVAGNYAYVSSSNNSGEIRIVNISNPAAPVLTNTIDMAGTQDATSLYISGNYLYVTRTSGSSNEFNIYNLTNPALPAFVNSLDMAGSAQRVTIQGNYAYIGTNISSLEVRIVNISNPLSISVNGNINLSGSRTTVSLVANSSTLFIGDNSGRIYSYGIANPVAPTLQNTYLNGGSSVYDMVIGGPSNNLLFAGSNNGGSDLTILDITNPASPSAFGSYNVSGSVFGIDYDATRDIIVGATTDNSQELVIFSPS